VPVKLYDVSIPFVGDPESFRIAPSRCGVPQRKATIGSNALTITIPDDDNADSTIDNFKKTIEGNLQTARSEYAQMKAQLDQTVSAAAERRRQEIVAEDARDKSRSFRVIN
jgi:Skp family chaperone for outer membrane proteins